MSGIKLLWISTTTLQTKWKQNFISSVLSMLLTHASERNIGNYFWTFTTTLQTKPNHPWPQNRKEKNSHPPPPSPKYKILGLCGACCISSLALSKILILKFVGNHFAPRTNARGTNWDTYVTVQCVIAISRLGSCTLLVHFVSNLLALPW
jgi:hypothetical protein